MPTLSSASGGITLVPGDSAVYLETMGDLVLSGVSDAGRVRVLNTSIQAPGHGLSVGGGQSWFSLWTPATAINLLSAGGNVTPDTSLSHEAAGSASVIRGRRDRVSVHPARDGGPGNIYYGRSAKSGSPGSTPVGGLLLAPSASGELSFLAQQSIYGGGTPVSMSGSDTPPPTPFMPAYAGYDLAGGLQRGSRNNSIDGSPVPRADGPVAPTADAHPLFAFGPDTPGAQSLRAEGAEPIRFYAVQGRPVGLSTACPCSTRRRPTAAFSTGCAAAPVQALAGRDIAGLGGVFLHNGPSDVSLLHAGRDIWYADVKVAGPGLLDVVAGRNLVQEDRASIVSAGPSCAATAAGRGYRDHGGPARPVPTTTRWASAT